MQTLRRKFGRLFDSLWRNPEFVKLWGSLEIIAVGETSAALVGPGLGGGLIELVTAPFAIVLDALTFFASALMLRRIRIAHDVPVPGPRPSVTTEIHEGLKLVWNNRTLQALAWLGGVWQILPHLPIAVLLLLWPA